MKLHVGKKVAGIAVAGAVVLGGAGAAAWADTTGGGRAPSIGNPPAATAHPRLARLRSILAAADHGSLEIKDQNGTWITVGFDRGRVTDVATDHVTLARPDGQSVTLKLTPDTRYRGVTGEADVRTGNGAVVVSNADGTARLVAQRDKASTPPAAAPSAPTPG